jgi:hypothetical protein
LLPAARHYRERAEHAAAMVAALCDEQVCKTLTIGNTVDSVIPPASMRLPAVSRVVHWVQGMNATSAVNPGPSHVVLPRFTPGFSIQTALLPHSYREHLTWSAAKVAVIQELIRATLPLAKVGS